MQVISGPLPIPPETRSLSTEAFAGNFTNGVAISWEYPALAFGHVDLSTHDVEFDAVIRRSG